MKNQNKILMSLLTASISALATAPALAAEDISKDKSKDASNSSVIDMTEVLKNSNLNESQLIMKKDIKSQVDALLSKKAPIMQISESINIVVDSYGYGHASIKQQVFEDLNLGLGTQDSTVVNGAGYLGGTASGTTTACHATCHTACHGVCHGACHGSRGWR